MKWGAIWLALVAGCGGGDTLRDGICYRDGAVDCGGPCLSFDEEAAAIRDLQCQPTLRAEIGTCGEYRYTHRSYTRSFLDERFFDASGRIIALEGEADLELACDGGDAIGEHYGPVLDCQKLPTEVICPGI